MITTRVYNVNGFPKNFNSLQVRDYMQRFGCVLSVIRTKDIARVTVDRDRFLLSSDLGQFNLRITEIKKESDLPSKVIPYSYFSKIYYGYPSNRGEDCLYNCIGSFEVHGSFYAFKDSGFFTIQLSMPDKSNPEMIKSYMIDINQKHIFQYSLRELNREAYLVFRLIRPPRFYTLKDSFPADKWMIGDRNRKAYKRISHIFPEFSDLLIFHIKNLTLMLRIPLNKEYEILSAIEGTLDKVNFTNCVCPERYLLKEDLESSGLPYATQMWLLALMGKCVLSATQLTIEDLRRLGSFNQKRLQNALQFLYAISPKVCTEEAPDFIEMLQLAYDEKRGLAHKVRKGFHTIWKVIFTPTLFYVTPGDIEWNNRVTRAFPEHVEDFLRLSFSEENKDLLCPFPKELLTRVANMLKCFKIAGKTFSVMAFSSSQLRAHSSWLMSTEGDFNPSSIREWLGDFSKITIPSKFCSRIGQAFSSGKKVIDLESDEIKEIEDIKENGHIFSDGIGTISRELLDEISSAANIKSTSAFQFRMGGIKGVVSIDERLEGRQLCVRPSMIKFKSDHREFELVNHGVFRLGFLNRQLIMLLSTLGVPDQSFITLQTNMLNQLDGQVTSEIIMHLNNIQPDNQAMQTLRDIIPKRQEAVVKVFRDVVKKNLLMNLYKKSTILVPKAAVLMGVLDEQGILNYGQVFLQIKNENPIVGKVVIGKNPCLHPGDIRVLEAVDFPELHCHQNVLVFPSRGKRPHPNECSGSDLDGDLYFVSWESSLIPPRPIEPMEYEDPLMPNPPNPPYNEDHMIRFFITFISNDKLGQIDNAHLAIADSSEKYALDEKCIELCKMHSLAVDFPKNGIEIALPNDLKPETYPDFMLKKEKPTHQSRKVIGKLFQAVEPFMEDNEPQRSLLEMDRQFKYEVGREFEQRAFAMTDQYMRDLEAYLKQYSIGSELEFLIGQPVDLTGPLKKRRKNPEENRALLTQLANDLLLKHQRRFEKYASKELAIALYQKSFEFKLYAYPWMVASSYLLNSDD